ncbi:MAG: M23 family metallopeptidase [Chitinophagia bacterium]|nr:M23 family metallopeptidase [Chitinophagia bacterium]
MALLSLTNHCKGQDIFQKQKYSLDSACYYFDMANSYITEYGTDPAKGLAFFQTIFPQLDSYYHKNSKGTNNTKNEVFPLQGYNAKAIGGKQGSGYIPHKYNYFDGNRHLGHPAHDIFINDKNQDALDDITGKPVNVLSASYGIVVALENKWDTASAMRGGNYIWIYNAAKRALYYYAHNSKVVVKVGDIVEPGTIIATVGRTGANAYKKRSPTHLHFMMLVLEKNYYPVPQNTYQMLVGKSKEN